MKQTERVRIAKRGRLRARILLLIAVLTTTIVGCRGIMSLTTVAKHKDSSVELNLSVSNHPSTSNSAVSP